jgi:hypothetical protein
MQERTTLNTGHCFTAIDIRRFRPVEDFQAAMDDMLHALRDTPRAEGQERASTPRGSPRPRRSGSGASRDSGSPGPGRRPEPHRGGAGRYAVRVGRIEGESPATTLIAISQLG